MKFILYAFSFLASVALLTAGVLVAPGIWMPFAVAILVTGIASSCGWASAQVRSSIALAVAGAMGLTVLLTSTGQPRDTHAISRHAIAVGLGIAAITGCAQCMFARSKATPAVRRSIEFGLAIILMAAIVGYVSSDAGSASRLGRLFARLGLDKTTTDQIMAPIRKSIHFLWYGSVGWVAFRAGLATNPPRAVFSGLATTLVFACFDEFRQSMESSRTGSIWDVALDTAGAVAFVGVGWRMYRRAESRSPRNA